MKEVYRGSHIARQKNRLTKGSGRECQDIFADCYREILLSKRVGITEIIQSIDFRILDFIRENLSCRFLDIFLGIFTFLGNGGAVWIALTVFMLISKKHRPLGIVMAIGLVFCLLTGNILLKNLAARSRPFIINTDVIPVIPPPSGYSFPSGHSYSSFMSAVIMSKYSRRLAAAAIPAAVLIAFSRLYFYVHFPTDVLIGSLMGIVFGLLIYRLCEKKIICKNANPK